MKRKFLTLLSAFLCFYYGAWADITLFDVDFTQESKEEISTSNSGATFVSKTYQGYSMSFGVKSGKSINILDKNGGLQFSNNNYNSYTCLAIPLSLTANNKVTVTITLPAEGKIKYGWASGSLPSTPSAPSGTAYSTSSTTNTLEYTPASAGNYVLYLGRNGDNAAGAKVVSSILITQVSSVPSITASNVNIAADATSGEISYTLDNLEGGTLSAGTAADWISSFTYPAGKVAFVTTANNTGSARSATVTLTYTKDASTLASKNVTVTQAKPIEYIDYDLLNLASDTMVIGGTYIFYGEKTVDEIVHANVSAPMEGSNKYFSIVDAGAKSSVVDAETKQLTVSDENTIQQFIFSQVSATTWTIADASTPANYLYVSGDNQISWSTTANVWTMTSATADGITRPLFACSTYNSTAYTLKYNATNTRFNAYTSNQSAMQLYHLSTETIKRVTLDPNYGSVSATKYKVKSGTSWVPVAPTRSGYTFTGWATTSDGDVSVEPEAAYTVSTNATLYAIWEEIASDPEATPSKTSVDISAPRSMSGTASFTFDAENISDDLTLEFASSVTGLSVSPTTVSYSSATIEDKGVTINYSNNAAASGSVNLYIKQGETTLATIAVNYTSTAALADITSVSTEKTWTFSGHTESVQPPSESTEYILGNIVSREGFDGDAIKGMQQYVFRVGNGNTWQGKSLTFNTTVPGTVTVSWSSTSGSNNRTLKINDDYAYEDGYKSTDQTTTTMNVDDGDVVLTGWNVSGSSAPYTYASNNIRIYTVKFTPVYTRSLTSGNWGTLCLPYAVNAGDYSGATFYSIVGKRTDNGEASGNPTSIVIEEVAANAQLVAGRPYIFEATGSQLTAYQNNSAAAVAAGTHNGLVGSLTAVNVSSGMYIIYNNGSTHEVRKAGSGVTIGANKAYINLGSGEGTVPLYEESGSAPGRLFEIPLQPENTTELTNIENSANIVKFFENGILYIMRDGMVYDALGRIVK